MENKYELREGFLKLFVARVAKALLESKNIRKETKYPDIEKIKENIKIYENPESNLANVIIMNQNPEINNLMNPFAQIKQDFSGQADIVSIMEKEKRGGKEKKTLDMQNILPLPNKNKPVHNFPAKFNFNMPVSKLMPADHPRAKILPLQGHMRPVIVQTNPIPVKIMPAVTEKITILGLAKLDKILVDPAVQTIECPGPNKQMLIYMSGSVQTANLSLTGDEINNIMNEISQKTRIPLMSGIFKAAYGNLVITAVMSDFVGTRFIIQKKVSRQQQQSSIYK